jgi:hypothetical protein
MTPSDVVIMAYLILKPFTTEVAHKHFLLLHRLLELLQGSLLDVTALFHCLYFLPSLPVLFFYR